jgi:solute carrier family 25 protein 39/40
VRHMGDSAVEQASSAAKIIRPEDRSMPRFLFHIFQEQGVRGLFKGWAPRCLKVAPACAIMISSYEVGKKMANEFNDRRES